MNGKKNRFYLFLFLLLAVLSAFFIIGDGSGGVLSIAPSATPFKPPAFTITPTPPPTVTPTSTLTPEPSGVWLDPNLPEEFRSSWELAGDRVWASDPEAATTWVQPGEGEVIGRWIYALAGPFSTVRDGVAEQDLRRKWRGERPDTFPVRPLLMTASTRAMLSAVWGDPGSQAVQVLEEEDLLEGAWREEPAWAVVPFDQLTPSWKVLQVGGQSPLGDGFDPLTYALSVPIGQEGKTQVAVSFLSTNRNPEHITRLVMTGVTALVRATAFTMEQQGINYPARDLRGWLKEADITHISNEVPFTRECPYPDPNQKTLQFCSDPRYIKLLESIGTDVVELTGDHFGDWGPEAMRYTLELYRERGWPYYGGGEDLQDARQPVKIEHHGNRLAFIGCNAKGGGYAGAAANYPGAVACNFNYLQNQIKNLKAEGYLPIATFQHFEYYTYRAQPDQIRDAARLAEAGAVIVSGSQAHQPQAFQITEGGFIHHGLGNLFFDQIYEIPPNTATAFIDRHVFYQGRHLSTELLTIKFVDFARARPMTTEERRVLLEKVFLASGW